jgi:hypothetical protein
VDWVQLPAFRRAQDLAVLDGSFAITEGHLLVGILESESNTRRKLEEQLGPPYSQLLEVARSKRRDPEKVIETPGLDNLNWPAWGEDDDWDDSKDAP